MPDISLNKHTLAGVYTINSSVDGAMWTSDDRYKMHSKLLNKISKIVFSRIEWRNGVSCNIEKTKPNVK